MNYGNLSYNNSIFTGDIDKDGTIYSVGAGRERLKVGIDAQREQDLLQTITEMQETLENWKPKMIEHGYIKIQKSPEEIARDIADEQIKIAKEQAAQQAQINQALLQAITTLQNQIGEMKNNGRINGHSVEFSSEQIGENSGENRQKPTRSKASNRTRKTSVITEQEQPQC